MQEHFIVVTPEGSPVGYNRLRKDGCTEYSTREAAQTEAKALASASPGKDFVVYGSLDVVRAEVPEATATEVSAAQEPVEEPLE